MKKKLTIIFSGPSGVGKSTLIDYLLKKFDCAGLTVSHTTRAPRNEEVDGVNYHFVTLEQFNRMVENGDFVEYVECYGNFYGTSKQAITEVLRDKDICVLDLEYEGAYRLLSEGIAGSRCVGILVLPPSLRILKQRLCERKSETSESLWIRINEAFKINKIAKYDYVIINDDLKTSEQTLLRLIEKELNQLL